MRRNLKEFIHFRVSSIRFARDPKARCEETLRNSYTFGSVRYALQGARKLDAQKPSGIHTLSGQFDTFCKGPESSMRRSLKQFIHFRVSFGCFVRDPKARCEEALSKRSTFGSSPKLSGPTGKAPESFSSNSFTLLPTFGWASR